MKNESVESIIELVEIQKATLEANPFMEMDLVLKGVSTEVLKRLAKFYYPTLPSDETINRPSEVSPYFYFNKRINGRLLITFRTCSFSSTITFN